MKCKLENIVAKANTGLDAIRRAPIVDGYTGIKCLRIQDISQNKKYINWGNTKVTASDYEKARLRKGDIIMARTCSPGIVFLAKSDIDAVFNNGLARIRPDLNKTSSDFLFYLFKSPEFIGHIYGISGGTSVQLNMKLGDLLSYELTLPSLPEQKAIASVLSSLDDKIDLLHRQNATLEAMAETLFRQWFVEEAKEEWEDGKLGDVLELVYGKALKEEIRTGKGYPVVGSSGIVGYHSEFLVESPGIVIGRKGTLGKVNYLFDNFYPIDTTYFVKSKVNSDRLFYEYFLLKTMNFLEMNSDSAVPGLNRDIALSSEILIPPFELIKKFNSYCMSLFKKLKTNNVQINTLISLRDTLLPKLMSGEVRVKN